MTVQIKALCLLGSVFLSCILIANYIHPASPTNPSINIWPGMTYIYWHVCLSTLNSSLKFDCGSFFLTFFSPLVYFWASMAALGSQWQVCVSPVGGAECNRERAREPEWDRARSQTTSSGWWLPQSRKTNGVPFALSLGAPSAPHALGH